MSMSAFGGFGSQDPFADLLGRFFGMSPASSPPAVRRVQIGRLLTDSARDLLTQASVRAQEDGSDDLDTEHLLWAATEAEPTRSILAPAGVDPDQLAKTVEAALPGASGTPSAEPGLTPSAKRVLLGAHARSQAAGTSYIGAEHILAALLEDPDSGAGRLLAGQAMDPRELSRQVEGGGASSGRRQGAKGGARAESDTPTLDRYGRDLTGQARAGRLDPVVGRAEEIEQTIEIPSRRGKNNPVLIGEPGVGETAIVEGPAQRIVAELHTVVGAGAGGAGTTGAGNILEPALARGELRVVGATTIDEYRRHLEKDAAIERRFQPVLIPEPGVEETIQILEGELEVAQAAKRRLAELGRQPEFGARPLRRTLQTELDNRLATLLLDGTVEPGDTVRADIDDAGRLTAAIGRPAASRETQGTPDTRRVPAAERQAGLESPDTENGGAEQ